MKIYATAINPNSQYQVEITQARKKSDALVNQMIRLHLSRLAKVKFVKGEYYQSGQDGQFEYVFQYGITLTGEAIPTYSVYILFDPEVDFIIPFIGIYGEFGAITMETMKYSPTKEVLNRELQHAKLHNCFDVKFVKTYKLNPLPERLPY